MSQPILVSMDTLRRSFGSQVERAVASGAKPGAEAISAVLIAQGIAWGRLEALGKDTHDPEVVMADYLRFAESDFKEAARLAHNAHKVMDALFVR